VSERRVAKREVWRGKGWGGKERWREREEDEEERLHLRSKTYKKESARCRQQST
jgi:hypothetical protein